MDGIILIDKEKDWTSFDIVAKIRNTLKVKVGHTGTLDPMATGLLVILLGNACKLEQYLVVKDKAYIVDIKFGIKTDTGDRSGLIIKEDDFSLSNYSKKDIKAILKDFVGKQIQIPPKYSALKHEGESLYRIAREKLVREEVLNKILEDKSREIEIFNIEILEILTKKNILRIKVSCSSGTYIRTLAEDIAEKAFKTVATVNELRRLTVGQFNVNDSCKITEIVSNINKEKEQDKDKDKDNINNTKNNVTNSLINNINKTKRCFLNIEEAFLNFPKARIEGSRVYYFKNGVRITNKTIDGLYRVYSFEKNVMVDNLENESLDKFIGLGLVEENLMKRKYIYED